MGGIRDNNIQQAAAETIRKIVPNPLCILFSF
jgi:hypothetical protein